MRELITDRFPDENETVWFQAPGTQGCAAGCGVWDRRGWHLGWWSGSAWHSYVTEYPMSAHDVTGWVSLDLPGEEKNSRQVMRAIRRELNG